MASWTLLEIAGFIYRWSSPFFALVSFVFGILILFGKNKNLKLLGLGMVLGLFHAVAACINTYLPDLYNAGLLDEDFYRSGNVSTVKTMLGLTMLSFSVVFLVLRWLYTRRAYGTRAGVLIAVLVLMMLSPVAQVVMNRFMNNAQSASEYYKSSVYLGTVSLLFSIATTAVFLEVFYKNRKTEKAIPSYWVFFLLFILADIVAHLITIGAVNNMNNDNYTLFAIIIRTLLGSINPVSNIYLFMGSRKSNMGEA